MNLEANPLEEEIKRLKSELDAVKESQLALVEALLQRDGPGNTSLRSDFQEALKRHRRRHNPELINELEGLLTDPDAVTPSDPLRSPNTPGQILPTAAGSRAPGTVTETPARADSGSADTGNPSAPQHGKSALSYTHHLEDNASLAPKSRNRKPRQPGSLRRGSSRRHSHQKHHGRDSKAILVTSVFIGSILLVIPAYILLSQQHQIGFEDDALVRAKAGLPTQVQDENDKLGNSLREQFKRYAVGQFELDGLTFENSGVIRVQLDERPVPHKADAEKIAEDIAVAYKSYVDRTQPVNVTVEYHGAMLAEIIR